MVHFNGRQRIEASSASEHPTDSSLLLTHARVRSTITTAQQRKRHDVSMSGLQALTIGNGRPCWRPHGSSEGGSASGWLRDSGVGLGGGSAPEIVAGANSNGLQVEIRRQI